ncbi:MAG TPA: SOS response-associated peptidase [Devosia sp.]|nr:SOS response-associated peptidase [Devosia sp.]
MCGRYALLLPPEAMARLFRVLGELADYPPRYNIAPTQPVVTILERHGRRTAELFRWGFVPSWVRDPRQFALIVNARGDTMAEKPSFRDALRNSRCVLPASGYYEWKSRPDGSRWPYYITLASGEPMAFAGLYSTWAGPNGEEVDTVCIVTTAPSPEISAIHDRMPALLRGEALEAWLNTREVESRDALKFIAPPPVNSMAYHPVSQAVNKADTDGPELIAAVDPGSASERTETRRASRGIQLDLF